MQYHLWLKQHIRHAALVSAESLDHSFELFRDQDLEVLAGLRPKLLEHVADAPDDFRILDGSFMAVQQAVGCLRTEATSSAGLTFLSEFVEGAKASGLVNNLIERHGVVGRLSQAPPHLG